MQMVSAISFGWLADFGKTLSIIQRSSMNRFILTNGKHPIFRSTKRKGHGLLNKYSRSNSVLDTLLIDMSKPNGLLTPLIKKELKVDRSFEILQLLFLFIRVDLNIIACLK